MVIYFETLFTSNCIFIMILYVMLKIKGNICMSVSNYFQFMYLTTLIILLINWWNVSEAFLQRLEKFLDSVFLFICSSVSQQQSQKSLIRLKFGTNVHALNEIRYTDFGVHSASSSHTEAHKILLIHSSLRTKQFLRTFSYDYPSRNIMKFIYVI